MRNLIAVVRCSRSVLRNYSHIVVTLAAIQLDCLNCLSALGRNERAGALHAPS